MGAVAIHSKVLKSTKQSTEDWLIENLVVCSDPKISKPAFQVCRHETIGGDKIACYVFLPPDMTLSQVSQPFCRDLCKAIVELALKHAYTVEVSSFYATPRRRHVRYGIDEKYGRVNLYIDYAFSTEKGWKEFLLAIKDIRDHLRKRR